MVCRYVEQHDLMITLTTSARGEVVYWNYDSNPVGDEKVVGKHVKLGTHSAAVLCIMYHPFLELIVTGCVDHSMKGKDFVPN